MHPPWMHGTRPCVVARTIPKSQAPDYAALDGAARRTAVKKTKRSANFADQQQGVAGLRNQKKTTPLERGSTYGTIFAENVIPTLECQMKQSASTPAANTSQQAPGDEAAPGTPGTGENICPVCNGSGRIASGECQNCRGTGRIMTGIGGA